MANNFSIKNHKCLITFFAIFILCVLLGVNYYLNTPAFTKVIKTQDIAPQVYKDLKQIDEEEDLQRMVYFFEHGNKQNEVSYVAFCGGEDYKNGYDVNIVSLKGTKEDYKEVLFFDFNIKESTISQVEYVSDFSRPIVIFKAKKIYNKVGELVNITINQNNEEIEREIRWIY